MRIHLVWVQRNPLPGQTPSESLLHGVLLSLLTLGCRKE